MRSRNASWNSSCRNGISVSEWRVVGWAMPTAANHGGHSPPYVVLNPALNTSMRAEIISIGDELTTGQRLDTNSQWLAERLLEIGVPVAFHTTVGDQLTDNVLVFRQACERADVVVATGGLGPTADDLTRQALADLAGVPLIQDDASLAHIKTLFAKRKREMPPSNVIQAQFPQGSRPIFNPNGSAPGIDISTQRAGREAARIFALPG